MKSSDPKIPGKDLLKIGLVQMAPVWLSRQGTLDKVASYIQKASDQGVDLVVFGESIVPGYPFWLSETGGSRFDDPVQKELFAHYASQSVCIEQGDLQPICNLAKKLSIAVYLGITERPVDRGGHSLYCSLVFVNASGVIDSVHRKLMPTYEERLVWSIGDGHGLKTHFVPPFTVGGLNCWENWMPLARTALYGQGEDLHISVWPGNRRNTFDLIPVLAKESRSYVAGVSGLFSAKDLGHDLPQKTILETYLKGTFADGGTCLAAPDGSWVIEPFTDREDLVVADISHEMVRKERQNFDPTGHYSRPDVLQLRIDTKRQGSVITE